MQIRFYRMELTLAAVSLIAEVTIIATKDLTRY